MRHRMINRFKIIPWIIPFLLLLLWQFLTASGIVPENVFPKPMDVVQAFIELMKNGQLESNVGISAGRAFAGFLIGGGIGFLFGLLNGLFKGFYWFTDTSIQMIRNVPHLAVLPLVIVWFGVGETGKVFLVALGVLFPIYINTLHGIRSVDPKLIEMGRVYGLSKWSLFTQIILPGSLSSIFVGIRYALGVMWLTLIVAETVATNSGIGYMAMNARDFMQMNIIVLSIIIYALLGKMSDLIAKLLEHLFLKWE
ncbi:ABC transporter permease subunit [Sporolactobacillus sp. STSJ-5]|uniref:ABC transporter permease subunit n=1 Tax=Sporolactobacillus sp. STSJ-5 TaxID=2965076 RepID=UPI0021051B34|nr:ABC transporter permease subunit [Sporolactobacillus sp. STSJ-5]MCQ2009467.1 ABC transporter permease subunit [Sporolactobacillus sp. STSJ-5]